MLASKMKSDIGVSNLAKKLGITQPAASQHIKVLKNVGILESSRDGYHIYCNVNVGVLKEHKKTTDSLFNMAFTKCEKYGKCGGHGGK